MVHDLSNHAPIFLKLCLQNHRPLRQHIFNKTLLYHLDAKLAMDEACHKAITSLAHQHWPDQMHQAWHMDLHYIMDLSRKQRQQ